MAHQAVVGGGVRLFVGEHCREEVKRPSFSTRSAFENGAPLLDEPSAVLHHQCHHGFGGGSAKA